jgi:outer membrane protein OmpA-like peptidoglycan-associated protein
MKQKDFLPKEFTIEFDHYELPEAYGISVWFKNAENSEIMGFMVNNGGANVHFQTDGEDKGLDATMPEAISGDNYRNKWHHIAMIMKGRSIKIYVDQYRVLNVPNNTAVPTKVFFGGIGNIDNPIIFKNVKIAEGGGMNMVGKAFTDGKYISHGIRFDVNKATITPESMGEINGIVKILQENPTLKFEIGGYTDSDGDDASNLKLSQARADAVKNQLVSLGIDGSKLTTKGYGETKPMGDNTTFEGKANNRRVEFVKL